MRQESVRPVYIPYYISWYCDMNAFHEKQKEVLLPTEEPHQVRGIPRVYMPLLYHYIARVSAKMTSAVFKRRHLEMGVYSSVGESTYAACTGCGLHPQQEE